MRLTLDSLPIPSLDRLSRTRRPCAKGDPPVVERITKREAKKDAGEVFRAAVWLRDGGRDRASGKLLSRSSANPDERGEVHHLKGRRVRPEWVTDPKRAVLLSATNHELADARGGKLLQIIGTDASKPLTFIRRDRRGREAWRRTT